MALKPENEFDAIISHTALPEDILQGTLLGLGRFNLTGRVTFDRIGPGSNIGEGGQGIVLIGTYVSPNRGNVRMAIKRLHFRAVYGSAAKVVAKEIYIWSKLKHPNVLQLLGFIIDENGLPAFVSGYMDKGTVLDYVKKHPELDVMRLTLGIAKGLEYLHEQDVIHSDIKSDNVLVTSSGDAVICDFGISRALNATQAALGGNTTMPSGPGGTARWTAYELVAESEKYTKHTKESDVWAFGMIVYELLSKERPYAHITIDVQVTISLIRKLLPGRPASFETWPRRRKRVQDVCQSCWNIEPKLRITMARVVKELKSLSSPLNANDILAEIGHLDLTKATSYDRANTFTPGTHSDIHVGNYLQDNPTRPGVGQLVAIKHYRPGLGPQDAPQVRLVNELQVWLQLKHPNILEFLGYVRESDGSVSLVSEWMGDKTLLRFLRSNYGRYSLHTVLGIAEGLAYLHAEDVIHGDIKSENVVISSTGDALICGFEFARRIDYPAPEEGGSTDPDTPVESVRWMAIELVVKSDPGGYATRSKESDVWAFGMTVYETLTETVPYSRIPRDVQVLIRIVQGELPTRPQSRGEWPPYKETLWELCESCWDKVPTKRPSVSDIVSKLKAMRAEVV
ncbi:hypothetical protein M0805_008209 [Coniferiporia weirii]|nr:hypothetical protein M0805_008209 [Coniferiporia weirii]